VVDIGLEDELAQFTRSGKHHEHFKGFHYTEGIKYLADRLRCYWLVDLVGSYQSQLPNTPFQLWRLQAEWNQSAVLTMAEDAEKPAILSHEIRYTDFRLREFSFYCVDRVMMLKGEY